MDDDRKISVLYGVILGVIGAAIGFGIWQVVKSKPAWFKIIILLILIPTCFTGVILIDNFQKPKFLTCEICGYKAVKPEGISCEYCASPIWAEVLRENPELLKEDWLREEQLWIFTPDSSAHKINFYEPAVASGFQKDNNWKPVVSEKDFN
ncbi:MAG: hypothetical protein IM638_05830 [Bacteroidetes bacterium]|nr:hypothetical protein [Bacteroidota bacterium]